MAQKQESDLNDDNANCDVQGVKSALSPFPLRFQPYVLWSDYNKSKEDLYFDLIKSKRWFLTEMNELKEQYRSFKSTHENASSKLVEIKEMWANNPDRYFNSNYNWYFTGGNLSVQKTPTADIVFYLVPQRSLKVIKIEKKSKKLIFSTKTFSPVLSRVNQTESLFKEENYIVAARHMDRCAVYKVCMDKFEDPSVEICQKIYDATLKKYSLTGMCINKYNLILADVSRWIAVYDCSDGERSIIKKHDTKGDAGNHFTQLESLTENTFVQLTSTRLNLWDIRQMEAVEILEKNNHPFGCMNTHDYERDQSLIYVSTTKEIQTIDIRMNRIMNKVPHMISDTPFMSAFAGGATEYVAFSSHDPQEKVILGKKGKTYYTPFQIGDASKFLDRQMLPNPDKKEYLKFKLKLLDNVTGIGMSMHDVVNMYIVNTLGDLCVYSSNVIIPLSSAEEEDKNAEGDQVVHDKLAKRNSEHDTDSGQEGTSKNPEFAKKRRVSDE